ncbi:MAG: M81 family metallopeptidase [Rhodospirillaceae bacterium]|nr:M81 family metallopeptidase [Rhodospirillaceae bacterium]
MPKVAVIRFSHEGNSFNPLVTGLAAFQADGWLTGAAVPDAFRGTASELGGAIAFVDARPDWQVVYSRAAQAAPGGPVDDAVIEAVIAEISSDLAAHGPFHGVYVSLHGAMVGTSRQHPDLDLLRAVRAAVGPACPVAASFDFHANMAPEIADAVDIVVGYKTYPHIDMAETAAKALHLLDRAMLDRNTVGAIRPRVLIRPVGLLLPSHNMRTGAAPEVGPMAAIEATARTVEADGGFYDVTPFGGFAYGDVPQAGASVALTGPTGGLAAAAQAAETLVQAFHAARTDFKPRMPGPADAIAQALAMAGRGRPVAVLEPADNPMSGGIGDTPGLFRALIEAAPTVPCLFAFFADPDTVAAAGRCGVGGRLDVHLGGRISPDFGSPVAVSVTVEAVNDGRFVNDGPMWAGQRVDLGPSALLRVGGVGDLRVIVTGQAVSPNDDAYFRLFGIDLANLGLLAVKAKNHFRAAFGDTFQALVDTDSPGPATADLAGLAFRHVRADRLD